MVMRANPFAEAIADDFDPSAPTAKTAYVPPRPFNEADRQKTLALESTRIMSRQELFERGLLTVKDLDDEELREGRCRDGTGRIPKRSRRTDLLPRDLYEAMVAEHLQRTNEKLRTQMDIALETMVNIMTDDTCEPKDRMEAAKYLYERVAGKTPDRVQVQVSKAPWEEVMGGIAQISRAESHAMRHGGNTIDAEVVEAAEPSRNGEPTGYAEPTFEPPAEPDEAEYGATQGDEPTAPVSAATAPLDREPTPVDIHLTAHDGGDLRIQPATPTPGYDAPQSTSATMPPPTSNADYLRQQQEEAAALAARRKEARKKIQDAKKRRAVARAMGRDAMQSKDIQATEANGKIQFRLD